MKTQKNQRGQAIMEMMIIMIAFMVCMMSIFVVIALTLGNIDMLMCGKTEAELAASNQINGNDGKEIRSWEYTTFGDGESNLLIPFSPNDKAKTEASNLYQLHSIMNNGEFSDSANERYVFNDFMSLTGYLPVNFAEREMYVYGRDAANLHKGKCSGLASHNILGCSCQKYVSITNRFSGGNIRVEKISESVGNVSYMPAMRIKYEY